MNSTKLFLLSFIGMSVQAVVHQEPVLLWQTHTANGTIYNYRYGQYEYAGCGTACAAMAVTAVSVLGNLFGSSDIFHAADHPDLQETIKNACDSILQLGAAAYQHAHKDARGYAQASNVAEYLHQQRYPITVDDTLNDSFTEEFMTNEHVYTTGLLLRNAAQKLIDAVNHSASMPAAGIVFSCGTYSRALIYVRGDVPEHACFILYDSHSTFPEGFVQQQVNVSNRGSFMGIAHNIDNLVNLATTINRAWWIDARTPRATTFITINATTIPDITYTHAIETTPVAAQVSLPRHHALTAWYSKNYWKQLIVPATLIGIGFFISRLFFSTPKTIQQSFDIYTTYF